MSTDKLAAAVPSFGGWQDAESLRKWSFQQRTPQQRLDWLVQALTIAYQCGAIKQAAGEGVALEESAAMEVARPSGVVPWP